MSLKINTYDNQISNGIFIPQSSHLHLIIGGIGSGKTTLLLNLLNSKNFYNQKFNEIHIYNPNAMKDLKWKLILNKELLLPNKKLLKKIIDEEQKKLLTQISKTFNQQRKYQLILKYKEYEKQLEELNKIETIPFTENDFKLKMTLQDIKELIDKQDYITENYGSEYRNNILVILDDMISFKKLMKSEQFLNMVVSLRHNKITLIITSQAYYEIPKTIRLQSAIKTLFRIFNKKELQDIYAENSADYQWDEFFEKVKSTYEKDHSFISLNLLNPYRKKMILNFQNYI